MSLTVGGFIVGVVTLVFTALATYFNFVPISNRRIKILVVYSDTPVLTNEDEIDKDLQLIFAGQALEHGRVVDIHIINNDARDIAGATFDAGAPLRLAVSTPILKLLDVSVSQPSMPVPHVAIEDDCVLIHPMVLRSGGTWHVRLLLNSKISAIHETTPILHADFRIMTENEFIRPTRLADVPLIRLRRGFLVLASIFVIYAIINDPASSSSLSKNAGEHIVGMLNSVGAFFDDFLQN